MQEAGLEELVGTQQHLVVYSSLVVQFLAHLKLANFRYIVSPPHQAVELLALLTVRITLNQAIENLHQELTSLPIHRHEGASSHSMGGALTTQ